MHHSISVSSCSSIACGEANLCWWARRSGQSVATRVYRYVAKLCCENMNDSGFILLPMWLWYDFMQKSCLLHCIRWFWNYMISWYKASLRLKDLDQRRNQDVWNAGMRQHLCLTHCFHFSLKNLTLIRDTDLAFSYLYWWEIAIPRNISQVQASSDTVL